MSAAIVAEVFDQGKGKDRDQAAHIDERDPVRHERGPNVIAARHFGRHGQVGNIEDGVAGIGHHQGHEHEGNQWRLAGELRGIEGQREAGRGNDSAKEEERAAAAPAASGAVADDSHQRIGNHVVELRSQQQGGDAGCAYPEKVGHEGREDAGGRIQDHRHAQRPGAEVDTQFS